MGSSNKQLASELAALSATPRFALLAALSLDRLLPKSAMNQKLVGVTLAQLVEAGPRAHSRYNLTAKQVSAIQKFISALVIRETKPKLKNAGRVSKVLALRPPVSQSKLSAASDDIPALSSIETEQRLMQAIGMLSSSPFFSIIAESKLADFWDPTWQRAPFEESLTFRQLAGMKVSSLLEKRGMNTRKVVNMIASIDRALEAARSPQIDGSSALAPPVMPVASSSSSKGKPKLVSTSKNVEIHWMATTIAIPETVRLIARGISRDLENGIANDSQVAQVIAGIASTITAREIVALALASVGEIDGLAHAGWSDAQELAVAASRKISAAINKQRPELIRSWMLGLQSAGVPISRLPDATTSNEHGSNGVLGIALFAIGARNPIVFGQPALGYWTMQPSALQSVLDAAVATLPKSDKDFQEFTESLLPFFEFSDVIKIFGRRISYNQRRAEWARTKLS